MGEGIRAAGVALGLCALACASAETDAPEQGTTGAAGTNTGTSDEGSTSSPPVPGDDGSGTESTDQDTEGSETMTTSSPPPAGPECSVQEITEGALMDPVDKANETGRIPVIVGETLEDYCGCHTLMSNNQNLKFQFLKAPGSTLFLSYDDLSRPFSGGTLGEAMAEQVLGNTMPPGSCSFPGEPTAILDQWFNEGMPDGATFEPQ